MKLTQKTHKLAARIFRSTCVKLLPKNKVQKLKHVNDNKFCHELDHAMLIKGNMYQTNNPYSNAIQIYSHPLKSKMIRGKQAPFLNKEIHKLIMQKSRIRNKYNK